MAAYERGKEVGKRSSEPFQGLNGLVPFISGRTDFEAVISYERALTDGLPAAARMDHADSLSTEGRDQAGRVATDSRVDEVLEELREVRTWLNAFVASAADYCARAPRLRHDPWLQPPPESIRIYETSAAFIAEDPRRALRGRGTDEISGADFGQDWEWTDPQQPEFVTRWRVSLIPETSEIYALERNAHGLPSWRNQSMPASRRVWLIRCEVSTRPTALFSSSPDPAWDLLAGLQRDLMRMPGSLTMLVNVLDADGAPGRRPAPR